MGSHEGHRRGRLEPNGLGTVPTCARCQAPAGEGNQCQRCGAWLRSNTAAVTHGGRRRALSPQEARRSELYQRWAVDLGGDETLSTATREVLLGAVGAAQIRDTAEAWLARTRGSVTSDRAQRVIRRTSQHPTVCSSRASAWPGSPSEASGRLGHGAERGGIGDVRSSDMPDETCGPPGERQARSGPRTGGGRYVPLPVRGDWAEPGTVEVCPAQFLEALNNEEDSR